MSRINSVINFKATAAQIAQQPQRYYQPQVSPEQYATVQAQKKADSQEKWQKAGIAAQVGLAAAFGIMAIVAILSHKSNKAVNEASIKSAMAQADYFIKQGTKEATSRRSVEEIAKAAKELEMKFEDLSERIDIVALDDESLTENFRKWAKELVSTASRPKAYEKKFGKAKAGQNLIIMYGGSGTGKSYDAEVLFKALGAKRLKMQFSDVSSKYIGETSVQLTHFFEELEYVLKNNPDKKFGISLDEFETLAKNIEKMTDMESHLEQNRTALINGLDRVRKYKNLYIVASSNVGPKSGKIDGAIARRFGKNIEIEYPTVKALKASLRSQFRAHEAEALIKDKEFDFFAENSDKIDSFVRELNRRYAGHGDVETIVSEAINKAENELNEICYRQGVVEKLPNGTWKVLDEAKQQALADSFRFDMKYLQEAMREKGTFAGEMGNQFTKR